MSETLSALIAFVGFLIVFSMLVQVIQEALKNAFKLKTGVWERFFIQLYKREFFSKETSGKKVPDVKSKSFWERVISGEFVGEFDERLKRLKEIVCKADMLVKTLKSTLHDIKSLNPNSPNIQKQILLKTNPLLNALEQITGLKLDTLLEVYDNFFNGKIKTVFKEIETFFEENLDLRDRIVTFKRKEIVELQAKCEDLLNKINEIEKMLSDYRFQIENKIDAWIAQVNE